MKKPVILLSCGFRSGELSPQRVQSIYYGAALATTDALAVFFAGGCPGDAAAQFDGLLLSGGGDLAPSCYGQSAASDKLSISPERDLEELLLLEAFAKLKKPVFGICRGIQVLNVFFGGTLIQHMEGHGTASHKVRTLPDSRLRRLCGPTLRANSYHHQAVAAVGKGLRVTARATDGIIEGLEHQSLPIFGVQWHPERQTHATCMDTPDDQRALFCDFAALCSKQ